LKTDWSVDAEVFSVTSFTQLRWDGMHANRTGAASWVSSQIPKNGVPVVAASDYVSSVADLIRPWIADRYVALGTDGFGRSDTRAQLRRFFEVDRHSVALAALQTLGDPRAAEAAKRYGLAADGAAPWTR
jgi:pyruvate dehydrogenase E1 component